MKNSSDTIGNRTRDLMICSTVPQPTALRRAPFPPYIIPILLKTCPTSDSSLTNVNLHTEFSVVVCSSVHQHWAQEICQLYRIGARVGMSASVAFKQLTTI